MQLHLLVAALRRTYLLIIAAAVVGAVAGAQTAGYLGTQYRATATLLLDPTAITAPLQEPFSGDPERYIGGQLRILEGEALAARAAEAVPGQDAEDLRAATSLEHVTGSDVVDVIAVSPSAELARDIADAVATTYVEQRTAEKEAAVAEQLAVVTAQITALEAAIAAVTETTSAADQRRSLLYTQLQTFLQQRQQILSPGATRDATALLEPASAPRDGEQLSSAAAALGGAALGALLGLLTAVALEARNPHVVGRTDAERVLGRPVPHRFPRAGGLLRRRDPNALRRLLPAARVITGTFGWFADHDGRRVVVVCAPAEGGDRPSVAAAIAIALAETGRDVVVVPVAATSGEFERLLGVQEDVPVTAAEQRLGRSSAARPTAWDCVRLSTGTGSVARPDAVRQLLRSLPAEADVVLSLPPILTSGVTAAIAGDVDDVVLVVHVPHADQHSVQIAEELLRAGGAREVHPVLQTASRPGRR